MCHKSINFHCFWAYFVTVLLGGVGGTGVGDVEHGLIVSADRADRPRDLADWSCGAPALKYITRLVSSLVEARAWWSINWRGVA